MRHDTGTSDFRRQLASATAAKVSAHFKANGSSVCGADRWLRPKSHCLAECVMSKSIEGHPNTEPCNHHGNYRDCERNSGPRVCSLRRCCLSRSCISNSLCRLTGSLSKRNLRRITSFFSFVDLSVFADRSISLISLIAFPQQHVRHFDTQNKVKDHAADVMPLTGNELRKAAVMMTLLLRKQKPRRLRSGAKRSWTFSKSLKISCEIVFSAV